MTKKITQESCTAFHFWRNFKKANMKVEVENVSRLWEWQPEKFTRVALYLHWNCIARYNYDGTRKTEITDAWWRTTTTKERLNWLEWVSISQKKWVWYLNWKELDSSFYEAKWYGSRLKWLAI